MLGVAFGQVLAMEEAEEVMKSWRKPVESPMRVVELCRKHFKPEVSKESKRIKHD